jgi:anoctamin-10
MNNLQIAIYFAFLGMYTRWLFFLAAFGLTLQLINFRWANLSRSVCYAATVLLLHLTKWFIWLITFQVNEISCASCFLCRSYTLGYNVLSILET